MPVGSVERSGTNVSDLPPLTEMEQLLLMAAAAHGFGPDYDIRGANTAKVVLQAIRWAGLDSDAFWECWERLEWHSSADAAYKPLIRMTCIKCRDGSTRAAERRGEALFEGGGNWGVLGD